MDSDFLVVDLFVLALMTSVGLVGAKYSIKVLRLDEMKQLRYIWEPGIVSGTFLYLLLIGQAVGHYGVFPDSPFYDMMSIFVYLGAGIYTVSVLRFAKIVKSFLESKIKAEERLAKIRNQSEDDVEKINEIVRERSHN